MNAIASKSKNINSFKDKNENGTRKQTPLPQTLSLVIKESGIHQSIFIIFSTHTNCTWAGIQTS
jgi:hypothetical protein